MRVKKAEFEALIREAVEAEMSSLNEEELEELLGGLRGMFGAGANAVGGAARAAGGAIQRGASAVGGAVAGAAGKAAGAVQNAASGAVGAVKGAYQAGEKTAAMGSVKKGLGSVLQTITQAMSKVGGDQEATYALKGVQNTVQAALDYIPESKFPTAEPRQVVQEKRWVRKVAR